MSEYENWFSVRFPNIQATIDQSNDQESKLLKLACKEVWQHQQAEIDQLNTVLEERTKEWLQAIECGTYFENVAKPLKGENDSLRQQLNNMEQCYIEKKEQVEAVSHMLEGDLKYVEQDRRGNFDFLQMAMIRCLGDAIKALRGEHE